jgi:hypothetical protein
MLLFNFILRSEKFKGSLNKEDEVSRVFLFGLFIWELGNPPDLAIFFSHAAAMVSPRRVELKQGAKDPSMEEAKRCEIKLPVEIKRTTRISCGGRVPTGAIASRNPIKEEKVPTPVRRSVPIRGMKRKDYKEVSPEPKDYGDSDYSDDRSPRLWAAAGRDDNDLYIWEEVPKEKAQTAATTTKAATTTMMVTTAAMTAETLAMTTLSGSIRCVVWLAVTPSRSSTHRSTNVSRPWRR